MISVRVVYSIYEIRDGEKVLKQKGNQTTVEIEREDDALVLEAVSAQIRIPQNLISLENMYQY